ncbi:MAG: flagellin N-terminal helical domain-containing protein [Acidimicrobiales bacterium]|jgi:flagellin|nr:flagellin [Actinomycetota bacterium]
MSSLVVNTNLDAINAYNNLNATNLSLSKTIAQLSSGLAIQTAADNPAGYQIAQNFTYEINGAQQAVSNVQNGVSLVQTADGALNQIASILQTMDQLAAANSSGGTTDPASVAANQQEFVDLQNEIQQIATTTTFGTQNLLNGSFSNEVVQVGAFATAADQITFGISAATIGALGIATGTSSIGTVSAALSALASVQAAISTVASMAAGVGAFQNELQGIAANLTVMNQNLTAAKSQLVDVNFAQATTQFSTEQILMQSGTAMLSQAQQQPALVLKLLT